MSQKDDLIKQLNLHDRRLQRSSLTPNLAKARYNKYTFWPMGFDPEKYGAELVE